MNNTTQRRSLPESKVGTEFLKTPSFKCARAIVAAATIAGLLTVPVAQGADPVRPLHVACDTTFAFNATGAMDITGSCHYSHLGLTKAVASQIVIVLPDGSLQIVDTSVYTAAT